MMAKFLYRILFLYLVNNLIIKMAFFATLLDRYLKLRI